MKRPLLAIPFVLSCLVNSPSAQSALISYDTFMRLDATARHERFPTLTPTNQAALLQEQVVRWQRTNANRLTPEQTQLLTRVAAFITPDLFDSSLHSESIKASFMALEQQASGVFTREELSAFTTIDGPYLPAQP